MVIDSIKNAFLYYDINDKIELGLKWLQSENLLALETGRYEIGDGCFAMVSDYETAPREEKRWEAHQQYIDIQFIASGEELIGWADIGTLQVVENRDEQKDITWLSGAGSSVQVSTGYFVILFPHDAHMPGVSVEEPVQVRKIVVKVPAD